jgi:hypothetical protein
LSLYLVSLESVPLSVELSGPSSLGADAGTRCASGNICERNQRAALCIRPATAEYPTGAELCMALLWHLMFRPIWWTPHGSVFGSLSKALIVLSNAQHRISGLRIIHLIREHAHFFCAGAPVVGLINEVANHSRLRLL